MQDTKNPATQGVILSQGEGLWYASIIFLLFIIGISGTFFVLTELKSRSLVNIQTEIQFIDKNLNEINTNPNIVIAKIVQENGVRPSIDLKNIVTQFRLAAIKANVSFDGFSIKDDIIRTTLTSTVGNTIHPDPVATIVSMMNDYAKNEQKEFRLGKISNISGDITKRVTAIELQVLSTPNK